MSAALPRRLPDQLLTELAQRLQSTDEFLEHTYPGDDGRRQPVHTVYVPGNLYRADLPAEWGRQARDAAESVGGLAELGRLVGLTDALAAEIAPLVQAKLEREPIEDLRIDFEDGYKGSSEDEDVVAAARQVTAALAAGTAPPFIGLRFKCFERATRNRGVRTFDLFLSTLLEGGELPDGLVLTFPKVSTVSQVEAMVAMCEAFESAAQLPSGRLGFEIQVETPPLILGVDGRVAVAEALHAGRGRVTSLHYGTYDYSASMGVAAQYQSMEHPVADQAKALMQLAVAGTGVHLSDGSTNILPVGDQARAAWALHARLVRRSLKNGIYQGWDLHPAQLPTRFLATYAFYRSGFSAAALRLRNYVNKVEGAVMDEPATVRAMARYVYRGFACGALTDDEVVAGTGLDSARIEALARPKSDTENVAAQADRS